MPDVGDLVRSTTGAWIVLAPQHCPNGHRLGPGETLVGHQASLGHGGGHTTRTCPTCDQTLYGPPLNTHCTAVDGPASVVGPPPAPLVAGRCHRVLTQKFTA